jgi:hypothetical protein
MANEEPKIASTVSFRPAGLGIRDEVSEQKYGFVEQEIARERGKAPDLRPPAPDKPAPKTPLAERLRQRLEKGGR